MILRPQALLTIVLLNHPIYHISRRPHPLVLEIEIDGPGNTMTTLMRTREEEDTDPVRCTP
jgi:hypothetical protein